MRQNYDTTNGLRWPRIPELTITEGLDGSVKVEFLQKQAMIESDDTIVYLEESAVRRDFMLSDIPQPVPLENPVTGEIIPGQFTTAAEVRLKLFAFLRAYQRMHAAQQLAAQQAAQGDGADPQGDGQ